MSMISSQCDELREKAKLLRGHVDGLSAPYVIPSTKELMALTMLDSADRMERAADTIWELRCKLAGVVDQSDKIERLKDENTKLRELFEKTYGYYVSGTLTPCDFCKRLDCEGNAPTTCEADEYDPDGIVNNEIERLMRELGIEVE